MKPELDELDREDDIGALLRQVGARHEPTPAVTEEVRRVVHDEWYATVAQRKRRQRVALFAVAASIAFFVAVASWVLRVDVPARDLAVTIARIDGHARVQPSAADTARVVNVGETLGVDAVLATDDATRVALAYGPDVSMRIDRGSKIQRTGPDRFRLDAGALYIDAHPGAEHRALVIETSAGEVRHLGTQYQVRQQERAVEVSIREGRVEIAGAQGASLASAGERVRIDAAGQVERDAISAQDPAWDWAAATSPPFAIDDRTAAEFLEWVARETGRQVAYASPEAKRLAETVKLGGSIENLDPNTALNAVLLTTGLERYETSDHLIGVRLASGR